MPETAAAPDSSGWPASYWAGVRDRVAQELRYPRAARRRHLEGMVTIRVVLDAHGNLLEAEAKSGADKPALVSAALTAVRRAAPFPPVNPAPSAGNSQAVIPIRFELEDVPTIEKGL